MVKCGVLFEARADNILTSFGFKGLNHSCVGNAQLELAKEPYVQ
jgi:hypothetical protein